MTKYLYHDGHKAISIMDDTPGLWQYFSNAPLSSNDELYAKVSAAYRAFNLKANTVGNMPFTLSDLKSGEEYDNSATWENKVKFLPNPSELFRLNTLSYMDSNTVYNLLTSDALGYKIKGLYHAVARTFTHVTDPITGAFLYDERRAGSRIERYDPDGKQILGDTPTQRIVRMWRLDHTTEVIPSPNTEALAIMNAAGVIYNADTWIRHFFERGGVVPMVIAMKGAVGATKKEEEEKSWSKWYLGLRDRFSRIFRVVNAETLDVKQVGSGIEQLKNNVIYNQSLDNIAMGTGMPLSLLKANSANYATAKEEKATWYENDIIPLCNWMAFEYNTQVFHPIGLHLKFHPETLDPNQEDETERANAIKTFNEFLGACATEELFLGECSTFGYELTDDLKEAAHEYYEAKKEKPAPVVVQTQPNPPEPADEPADEQKPEDVTTEQSEADSEEQPKKAFDYSSMIALKIPDAIRSEIQARYGFVDAETLDSLHITLVFLGDNRSIDKLDVIRAVSDFGMFQSPIKGSLQGLARFINGQEMDPLVCTFDSPQMPAVYSMLTGVLDNYHVPYHKDHGFIPHMTLAYIPKDAEMPIETIEPIEINFSQIYYVDGNVWYPVDLVGFENKSRKYNPNHDDQGRFASGGEGGEGSDGGGGGGGTGGDSGGSGGETWDKYPAGHPERTRLMKEELARLNSRLGKMRKLRRQSHYIGDNTHDFRAANIDDMSIEELEAEIAKLESLIEAEATSKWAPSLDELEDLRIWREVALRRLKKGESLDFVYEPHHGGLPEFVSEPIKAKLMIATTPDEIKSAFDTSAFTAEPRQPETPSEPPATDPVIAELAKAMNRMADAVMAEKTAKMVEPPVQPIINVAPNITLPSISLTAQMPEQGTVVVNIPEQPAPVVNVDVQPTPVEVKNEITPTINVRPAPVTIMEKGKRTAVVERDNLGQIKRITSDDES